MTADTQFYKRHYKGGIDIHRGGSDPGAAAALELGGRYSLLAEKLEATFKPGDSIVEIGCGNGQALMLLAARYAFARAIGIDVAFKVPQTLDGVEFRNSNLNDPWPFEDR
jgi:tRNA G46 methylase TrmB